jgi:hypothetical protein
MDQVLQEALAEAVTGGFPLQSSATGGCWGGGGGAVGLGGGGCAGHMLGCSTHPGAPAALIHTRNVDNAPPHTQNSDKATSPNTDDDGTSLTVPLLQAVPPMWWCWVTAWRGPSSCCQPSGLLLGSLAWPVDSTPITCCMRWPACLTGAGERGGGLVGHAAVCQTGAGEGVWCVSGVEVHDSSKH